jgi:hypothetical protein
MLLGSNDEIFAFIFTRNKINQLRKSGYSSIIIHHLQTPAKP